MPDNESVWNKSKINFSKTIYYDIQLSQSFLID